MIKVPLASPYIGEEEAQAAYKVVKTGWLSMGEMVNSFEQEFAQYAGSKHAIATSNGTTALHLALIAVGIADGDEVLVPAITFISTPNVVLYERAIPTLTECDPKTYNISLEDAERRLTKKTKAIIPVDMNGLVVEYESVLSFASKFGLKVVADSAESLGARYRGQKVGSIAPIHTFSFFPNKNLTTGEGGMITTNDDDYAELIRQLRNQGQDYRYHHIHLGYNYRMTDIQAAIGIEQLKRIEKTIHEKNRIAERYNEAFEDHPDISMPFIPEYCDRHAWYMYTVSVSKRIDRERVVDVLKDNGIDTRLSFPPIQIQPYYRSRFNYTDESLPISLGAWKKLINIPMWPGLETDKQDYVIENLKKIVDQLR